MALALISCLTATAVVTVAPSVPAPCTFCILLLCCQRIRYSSPIPAACILTGSSNEVHNTCYVPLLVLNLYHPAFTCYSHPVGTAACRRSKSPSGTSIMTVISCLRALYKIPLPATSSISSGPIKWLPSIARRRRYNGQGNPGPAKRYHPFLTLFRCRKNNCSSLASIWSVCTQGQIIHRIIEHWQQTHALLFPALLPTAHSAVPILPDARMIRQIQKGAIHCQQLVAMIARGSPPLYKNPAIWFHSVLKLPAPEFFRDWLKAPFVTFRMLNPPLLSPWRSYPSPVASLFLSHSKYADYQMTEWK